MAEKRMLWKNVSRSKKLSQISWQAKVLWTWAIPWFDRDGFIEADPDFLKDMVLPKENLSENDIFCHLVEIYRIGLWIPYKNKEKIKIYAFDPEFKNYQKIQYNREAKSDIKDCAYMITLDEVLSLQDKLVYTINSSNPPDKIRKDKIIKESTSASKLQSSETDQPVDNSEKETTKETTQAQAPTSKILTPNFPTNEEKELLATISSKLREIYERNEFNPFSFVQKCINQNINPKAINRALQSLLSYTTTNGQKHPNPWARITQIIREDNPKFNAADSENISNNFKKDTTTLKSIFERALPKNPDVLKEVLAKSVDDA